MVDINSGVFSKIEIEKFNLDRFIELYNFSSEDIADFKLERLGGIDGILLKDVFVKEEYRNKGYCKKLINDLKLLNKPIVLYSLIDSMEYWTKQGFKNDCFDGEYIFTYGI